MEIEEFLIRNLVDCYENYCKYAENMSDNDFDAMFVAEDGQMMSDRDYVKENYDEIFNEEVFDALYTYLIDNGIERDVSLKRIVNFLSSIYFVYNYYDGDNNIINFFKNASYQQIEDMFVENYDVGMDMIKAYFVSLVNSERYFENRERIIQNGDIGILSKFEYQSEVIKVITINDLLRNVICNLYNHFISNGCDDVTALDNTWEFFLHDFDPLGELNDLGCDLKTKETYKKYLLGLIYADLYEDIANSSIIVSDNYIDRLSDAVPLLSVTFNMVSIPKERNVRNRILKHFILLQDEIEKRKSNRESTLSNNRTQFLKKVNPLYQLDELTFGCVK